MSMALKSSPRTKTLVRGDEITAAAEINLNNRTDQNYTRTTVGNSRRTGKRSWDWYERIGEVHYAISRSARIAGYAKLQCVRYGDDGQIEDIVDSGLAAETVASITSPYGGTRGLIDRFYTLMKIPGDSYLINVSDPEGDSEGFHFMSPDEMDLSSFSRWKPGAGHLRWITVPQSGGGVDGTANSAFYREVPNEDMLGRVWIPSRRYVDLSDSALNALDVECEALDILTKTIKAKLLSRFALAGIMYLPDSIANARVTRNQKQLAGQEIDDTVNFLIAAMTRNVRNWEDASAAMPILLRGPGEAGEQIKHIVMDRELFETDLQLRGELINRILQGLDSNQDATKGAITQSHWGAWAASDEERRVAVQPDLEMMCWALTRLVLHKQLQADGMSPEEILRHGVWYELSASTVHANQQEDARQLRDRGLIKAQAVRRMSGVREDDQIGDEEYVRWVGAQTKNPVLMMHGLPEADKVDWEKAKEFPSSRGPAANSPADESESGPGKGDPGSPDDQDRDTPRRKRPA
jgi:hypothetical protein